MVKPADNFYIHGGLLYYGDVVTMRLLIVMALPTAGNLGVMI